MVEVIYKNPACMNREESCYGSYADYSLDGSKVYVHDANEGQEVIIIPLKNVVKISYIDVD